MRVFITRVLFAVATFFSTLAAALASQTGGDAITLSNIDTLPLAVWCLAMGNGIIAALDGRAVAGSPPHTRRDDYAGNRP